MTMTSRMLFYGVMVIMTAHCRCGYDLIDPRPVDDGAMDDGAMDDGAMDDGAMDDGAMDDGATPTTLVLTDEMRTMRRGSAMGTEYDDACASDQALVGMRVRAQEDGFMLISTVEGTCAELVLASDGTSITTVVMSTLPQRGDPAFSNVFDEQCPANQVVVGFEGRSGTAVDALALVCAPLTLQGGVVTIGATSTLTQHGGTNGTAFSLPCDAGQVARGRHGFVSSVVQSIGVVCATPALAP